MKLAVILPHTRLYGGVKRFFELGEALLKMNHSLIVFTPEGTSPIWYNGSVTTQPLGSIRNDSFDAVFITETNFLEELVATNSRHKILYFVRPSDDLSVLRKYPGVKVFANSTNGYLKARKKYGIEAVQAYGGVNTQTYIPKPSVAKSSDDEFVIMTYGRLVERKKGTRLVVRAVERLYRQGRKVRLLLFDTPVNEKALFAIKKFKTNVPYEFILNHPVERNLELYHKADIFVAAEKNAGHSNTAAEAMASGIPVIGTTSGTKDFLIDGETGLVVRRWSFLIARAIRKLMDDQVLRTRLATQGRNRITAYSWDNLARIIIKEVQ